MNATRGSRSILIGTILTVVVLTLFGLSFTAVFLTAFRAPAVDDSLALQVAQVPYASMAAPTMVSPTTSTQTAGATNGIPQPTAGRPPSTAAAPAASAQRMAATPFALLARGVLQIAGGALLAAALVAFTLRIIAQTKQTQPSADAGLRLDIAELRKDRRRRQATYTQIAHRTGLSTRHLAAIEHGIAVPDHQEVAHIRAALEAHTSH